ncbi:hypothetical protein BSKO_12309 [Bryopsis sp. KO-2023]|nr:hypothetical protein BSKO_12309 [Bryopsis sp. KO-2023]
MEGASGPGLWLAPSPSKRWCECFFLLYSPTWMIWALLIIVPFKIYESCGKLGYMMIGCGTSVPCFLLPLLINPKVDREKPFTERFWVKANVWIAIVSFIGNYFWTHYFYQVLGASYSFPSWDLNEVPICLYIMTHAYFCFYHAFSNVLIRRVRHMFQSNSAKNISTAVVVFLNAYFVAFMETLTISHFPYYSFVDRHKMYTVGSLFYAIYFFVSFPMFYRIEESPKDKKWSLWQVTLDSLAAGMLVTIILDLWRLMFGPIVDVGHSTGSPVPWI